MSELTTIARPYAKALMMHAKEKNNLDNYFEMLSNLKQVVENKEMKKILNDDRLDMDSKMKTLLIVVDEFIDEDFRRFISCLAQNDRTTVIPEIFKLFEDLMLEEKNLVRVVIETAYEIEDKNLKLISKSLENRFNKKIEINQKIDPSLIAGAIIRADDLVIDGSLREKLRKLETQIH
ncbi:MAG: hypothetical protein CMD90_02540 [Gammaproteobacteria bacterium]|nr:hypothetical protein [Gammaproteobacteria bacterium]|tara:strand:+ start:1504 stop:2037 length:534 start_codon:yes stop_codon:yes gene_type:complete